MREKTNRFVRLKHRSDFDKLLNVSFVLFSLFPLPMDEECVLLLLLKLGSPPEMSRVTGTAQDRPGAGRGSQGMGEPHRYWDCLQILDGLGPVDDRSFTH